MANEPVYGADKIILYFQAFNNLQPSQVNFKDTDNSLLYCSSGLRECRDTYILSLQNCLF